MIAGSVEWARTFVYDYQPFPPLLDKAAALMYAITTFHPFADGNKRTALMTTSYFIHLNGYRFSIPDDAPEFARQLAQHTIDDPGHTTSIEVSKIKVWLRKNIYSSFVTRFRYGVQAKEALKLGYSGDILMDPRIIDLFRNVHDAWLRNYIEALARLLKK
jgi:death-on-curing family protein